MMIQATDSARLQLRFVVVALMRRNADQAGRFVREIAALLEDGTTIEETATPISGFSELSVSEIVLHGYRLFFRTVNASIWLTGVCPTPNVW